MLTKTVRNLHTSNSMNIQNDQETQIQLLKEKKQVASLLKRMADDEEKKMIKIQEKELLEVR